MSFQLPSILQSNRVSSATRRALNDRLTIPPDYKPRFFSPEEFRFLQALADVVLPQSDDSLRMSVVAQIDMRLNRGDGAGWRYASLPPDPETYRLALRMLGPQLAELDDSEISEGSSRISTLLYKAQLKELDTADFPLSLWFEGFKVDLVRYWLADPKTMHLLQYEGFADNLDTPQPVQAEGHK